MDNNEFGIYKDIQSRTNGEIYIGVVGPVRTGKSTFIKKFMELCVLPHMSDDNDMKRLIDELPQSAQGKTIIHNAAREPEIKELELFLNKCGADISGAGGNSIVINGVKKLYGCEHSILPDRIETSTYMAFAAVTGGNLKIKNICTEHIEPVLFAFREAGCRVDLGENFLNITAPKSLHRIHHIKTLVYPGFPTDSVMPLMALCSVAKGTSVIEETIFQNRFKAAEELNKLGAEIKVYDRIAVVEGVKTLYGADVKATDLRGGAALICAGLSAEGKTVITELQHIDRGYEKIEQTLNLIGADIIRRN